MKVDTNGYGGRKINKSAKVFTNDSNSPNLELRITGDVERFVTIQPRHISLRGYVGDPVKSSVMITLKEKYPFKVLNARASKGKYISFQLEEIKKSQTSAYELTVENRKQDVGRYYDSIVLETDSEIRPQLDIRVYGFLRARKTD